MSRPIFRDPRPSAPDTDDGRAVSGAYLGWVGDGLDTVIVSRAAMDAVDASDPVRASGGCIHRLLVLPIDAPIMHRSPQLVRLESVVVAPSGHIIGYGKMPNGWDGYSAIECGHGASVLRSLSAAMDNRTVRGAARPVRPHSRIGRRCPRGARVALLELTADLLGVVAAASDKPEATVAQIRSSVDPHLVRACTSIYWVREPAPGERVYAERDGLHAVRRLRKAHHRGGTPATVRPRLSLVRGPR